ncbi:caspase [Tylopilus felleus]
MQVGCDNSYAFRDLLIASRGYKIDDIKLMKDERDYPTHLLPTRDNVLRQIDQLTSDAPEDCHFVFYFSGHGLEEEGLDHASTKADGKDGEIVCADGKPILDHILHDRLVKPLQSLKGSKLFALFDCCHSETLLDLQIGSGPNTYSRVWAMGPGQLFINLAIALVHLFKLRTQIRVRKRSNIPRPPRRASTKWRGPPAYETREVGELSVICLSACRNGQTAHDDSERGLTFTKCFIDALGRQPNITWTELRDTLKELIAEIQKNYEEAYLHVTHQPWTQEPRYRTTPLMNLNKKVSL